MNRMKIILSISIILISLASAAQSVNDSTFHELQRIKESNIKKAAEAQIRYFIIKADSNRFGYGIYLNGELFIQQTIVPAMGGNKGFTDTATAGKTAQLVIQKLKEGEMPPTITIDDLKKIKVVQ